MKLIEDNHFCDAAEREGASEFSAENYALRKNNYRELISDFNLPLNRHLQFSTAKSIEDNYFRGALFRAGR